MRKEGQGEGVKGEESKREGWKVLPLLLVELLCHKPECIYLEVWIRI